MGQNDGRIENDLQAHTAVENNSACIMGMVPLIGVSIVSHVVSELAKGPACLGELLAEILRKGRDTSTGAVAPAVAVACRGGDWGAFCCNCA